MAQDEFGLYTIIRPGPYICAEWDGGGFPNWLLNFKPAAPKRPDIWMRSDDPVFLAWSKHWYDAVWSRDCRRADYPQTQGRSWCDSVSN